MFTSTKRASRARRALAGLALAGAAAAAGAAFAPASAGASAPKPSITVQVRHRTLYINGGRGNDLITLRVPAAKPHVLAVDLGNDGKADAWILRKHFDRIVVRGGDGNDGLRIDETAGVTLPFSDKTPTSLQGDAGHDTLLGGSGAEDLRGGWGDDVVDGNRGNDIAMLGAGADEFIWDPGDGSDRIEGGDGYDLMTFNGAGAAEKFAAEANGHRLRFTRDLGNIVMDTNDVEKVALNALGGSDRFEVDNLSATDVKAIVVDEGGTLGVAAPDGAVDDIIVNGTAWADEIALSGSDGTVRVEGLVPRLMLADVEPTDNLFVSSLGGNDRIDASALSDTIHLEVNAGWGNDVVLGSAGADNVLSGPGHDLVDGNRGNDRADLGWDNDEFIWDPGDGSDTIEGRHGYDLMTFNGSSGDEKFAAEANGHRLRFTRDLGNIVMDTDDVEQVDLNALAGLDQITVNDLTGTDVRAFAADLAASLGGTTGDGQVDTMTVKGTPNNDSITISGAAGAVRVAGLVTKVDISHADWNDTLTIDGNGGHDTVDSTGLAPGTIQLPIS
jgi:Ca2+-binding RTX toxin-like protein